MTQALTDKTWFLYYKGFQIWLDDRQAGLVREEIAGKREMVNVDGRLLPLRDIALLKGEDNDRAEKVKRGDWTCAFGHWHGKGEECGHGLERPTFGS